ncbi:histone deacetylase 11 [Haematococcus lacustris]|uniref:Histone deacetylase 11 n=1 Tax=Haematococcus lacustris TaxID=44745 RepID=A0A6A0AAE6_HAELA|nr:histone deacetylase 11 [Haematococcus lacustris]
MPQPPSALCWVLLGRISFFGIEKLHPFDSCKFQKVVAALEAAGCLQGGGKQLVQPLEASQAVLSDLHTPAYLNLLHTTNLKVVQVSRSQELAATSDG